MLDTDSLLMWFLFYLVVGALLIGFAFALRSRADLRRERLARRRVADLTVAEAFYAAHGEFHGIWQEWNAVHGKAFGTADREQRRWALFTRAAAADAQVEALIARLVMERHLTDRERTLLGCYRQAYRTLGGCLAADLPLGVTRPDGQTPPADLWTESAGDSYVVFTELAAAVGAMVARSGTVPPEAHARASMRVIAGAEFTGPAWVSRARTALDLPPDGGPGQR